MKPDSPEEALGLACIIAAVFICLASIVVCLVDLAT